MALAERYEEDRIEIVGEHRILQVRTVRVIYDDATGEELARAYHREALTPDADVEDKSELVKKVARTVWTQQVKDAWANRPEPRQ